MTRSRLIFGLLLLMAAETAVQVGFKFAGDAALPLTFDLAWLERILVHPWLYVSIAGLAASFAIYMMMLRRAPVGPVFAASHLDVMCVTLVSIVFLGDRLNSLQALGCGAIVAGVLVLAVTESEG